VAEQFIKFMFSPEGQQIMNRDYLVLISPPLASDIGKLPTGLRDNFVALGKGEEPKKR
jgi:ABC-type Fe3+ transport system substrate-binding protein